jgi:phosphoribosyl-ATP pyrophosphohydrolase
LVSDRPDGLWATVVVDEHGQALGLAWSDAESLREAVHRQVGAYHSRRRGLWIKGKTSGATQELLKIDLDCDRDAIRFTVKQQVPGFCHKDTWTCWGPDHGLPALQRTLAERVRNAPKGSYTRRLLDDPELLRSKLLEEAGELADANGPEDVTHETADVVYFALVAMVRAGVSLSDVEALLDQRSLRVTRRPGNAKPPADDGGTR